MSMTPSMRWVRPLAPPLAAALLAAGSPASAQLAVYDPANHAENALQAARQLQSLTNEAQILINQARQLAASPYSHLLQSSKTLSDIAELATSVQGISADLVRLQRQFEELYPAAAEGLDPQAALLKSRARLEAARSTAQDLAATAAELERLAQGRSGRLHGALSASQAAAGQTAAIQSSTQMLSVLAEDLGAMRTVLLAQSRLMAQDAAARSADRAAAQETRRRYYDRAPRLIAPPAFDPFPNAAR